MSNWSRREFLLSAPSVSLVGGTLHPMAPAAFTQPAGSSSPAGVPESWPRQDPALALEMVGVCHSDVKRVRELVEKYPALANASVDWGYGDWEDALGAASHVGRREIAEVLLAHGARPSIFSAAMLGQLDVVRACVAARPGVQRTYGPHGITLMAHARAGGEGAAAVVAYLESLGDADTRITTTPLDPRERDALPGRYRFGKGLRDYVDVDVQNNQLGIQRPDTTRRFLLHTGDLTFFPSGVPSVKIAFGRENGRVVRLVIADPAAAITAARE